jgi:hypothetical protein
VICTLAMLVVLSGIPKGSVDGPGIGPAGIHQGAGQAGSRLRSITGHHAAHRRGEVKKPSGVCNFAHTAFRGECYREKVKGGPLLDQTLNLPRSGGAFLFRLVFNACDGGAAQPASG